MDVFAFPSLWEGLPLTLVEAQYAGLPCVVSENVTRDVVISEQCKLIKEFDSDLWCESLECNFGVRKRLNSVFSSQYDINKAYGLLNGIYKECVDG